VAKQRVYVGSGGVYDDAKNRRKRAYTEVRAASMTPRRTGVNERIGRPSTQTKLHPMWYQ